jgi:uncharacterized protein (TIGR02118 family)
MIRLVYVVRRLPNMTREEFQGYWRDNHGPLVSGYASAMKIRRYIQTHTIDDPRNEMVREQRGTLEPYDGVADLWWDNEDVLAEAGLSEEGQQASAALFEDERNFIDFSRSTMYFATEVPQINPTPENIVARENSTIVKVCYFGAKRSDLSVEEAQFYWRHNHGPLIRSLGPITRIKRYLQVHMIQTPFNEMIRERRGEMGEPFLGHAELWLDRLEMDGVGNTPEGARARELAAQDEARFIDFKRSAWWLAKEHVLVDR